MRVDVLCDHILSGAAFSSQQNLRVALSSLFCLCEKVDSHFIDRDRAEASTIGSSDGESSHKWSGWKPANESVQEPSRTCTRKLLNPLVLIPPKFCAKCAICKNSTHIQFDTRP